MARREPRPPQRQQDGRLPLSTEVDRLPEGPRVRGRTLVVLVVVVLLLVAAGWAEGRRRAPGERSELAACAERGEETAAAAERRLATTVTYLAPALGSHDDELHRSMLGLVSRTAGDVVGPVEEALARCREVGIWPSNRSHAAARDALVGWLTAERDRLRAVVEDGSAFDQGYAEVRRLADEAAATLED